MTPEEFVVEMQKVKDGPGDEEVWHLDADKLLCTVLRELGYGDGIDVFEKMDKWYA